MIGVLINTEFQIGLNEEIAADFAEGPEENKKLG
jgi:hypothetical protein